MDEQKIKDKIDTRVLGMLFAGAIAGLTLMFSYGPKMPFPKKPAVVQKVSELEQKITDDRHALEMPDPNTAVDIARRYVQDQGEYDALMQQKDVNDAYVAYNHAYEKFMVKTGGLIVSPVILSMIIGTYWKSRQYEKYGLNKKVLKQ